MRTFWWHVSMRRTIVGFAVLASLIPHPAPAQEACRLLQPAELEAGLKEWASGGKATKFAGAVDNSSGFVLDTCRSEIVRPGQGNLQITVVVTKNLPMSGSEAIAARNAGTAREGQWKVQGARFEQKTVGKATCVSYGRPSIPANSVCDIARGNGYVEVDVIAPSQGEVPSMDAVAALVQKANSRL